MKSQIDALRQLTHELLYLGMDGEPIYADRFRQLNSDVYIIRRKPCIRKSSE